MPYLLTKKNGKRTTQFMFSAAEAHNLARDPNNCYTLVGPVTRRTIRVGGKCRNPTPASLWGARRKRRRR